MYKALKLRVQEVAKGLKNGLLIENALKQLHIFMVLFILQF